MNKYKVLNAIALGIIFIFNGSAQAMEQEETAAVYEVTFVDRWNAADHLDFPPNAHYSPILAVTHDSDYHIFKMGALATPGLEQLAESGATSIIRSELGRAQRAGHVDRVTQSDPLFPHRDGRVIRLKVRVTNNHPLVSLATMIAPSPDWIVGVDSLNLKNGNAFVDAVQVRLYAINAGTEDGDFGGNFSINNPASNPPMPIRSLRGQSGFNAPFATVTFEKQ